VRVELARHRSAPQGTAAGRGAGVTGRAGGAREAPRGGSAASAIPVLTARLLRLQGRLAILTRSRSAEEMLLRTVRQIGVSRTLALLPQSAAPVVLALRLAKGLVHSLTHER
jgi:hypothetical protein